MPSLTDTLLAFAPPANGQQGGGSGLWNMIPLLLVMVFLYFAMIAPQRKRAKQQQEMINNLKSGDKVATSGGIIGVVVTVKERSISLRSDDSKFEVLKTAISEVLERKTDPADPKSERKAEPAEAKS